jgi:hypothetical protein
VKLEGERVWAQEVLVQKVFKLVEWPKQAKGAWASFYTTKRNIPVGVSEI